MYKKLAVVCSFHNNQILLNIDVNDRIFTARKRSKVHGEVCIGGEGRGSASGGGVCLQRGGSASRRGLHPGGGESASRGRSASWMQTTPPSDTTGYGQRVGGTHPILVF